MKLLFEMKGARLGAPKPASAALSTAGRGAAETAAGEAWVGSRTSLARLKGQQLAITQGATTATEQTRALADRGLLGDPFQAPWATPDAASKPTLSQVATNLIAGRTARLVSSEGLTAEFLDTPAARPIVEQVTSHVAAGHAVTELFLKHKLDPALRSASGELQRPLIGAARGEFNRPFDAKESQLFGHTEYTPAAIERREAVRGWYRTLQVEHSELAVWVIESLQRSDSVARARLVEALEKGVLALPAKGAARAQEAVRLGNALCAAENESHLEVAPAYRREGDRVLFATEAEAKRFVPYQPKAPERATELDRLRAWHRTLSTQSPMEAERFADRVATMTVDRRAEVYRAILQNERLGNKALSPAAAARANTDGYRSMLERVKQATEVPKDGAKALLGFFRKLDSLAPKQFERLEGAFRLGSPAHQRALANDLLQGVDGNPNSHGLVALAQELSSRPFAPHRVAANLEPSQRSYEQGLTLSDRAAKRFRRPMTPKEREVFTQSPLEPKPLHQWLRRVEALNPSLAAETLTALRDMPESALKPALERLREELTVGGRTVNPTVDVELARRFLAGEGDAYLSGSRLRGAAARAFRREPTELELSALASWYQNGFMLQWLRRVEQASKPAYQQALTTLGAMAPHERSAALSNITDTLYGTLLPTPKLDRALAEALQVTGLHPVSLTVD